MNEELPEKTTTDEILAWITEQLKAKRNISQQVWLEIAFRLNLLQPEEVHIKEVMRQGVAQLRLNVYEMQDKKNATAANMVVEAKDQYREYREQENKVERIDELIRIAKKNSDTAY